MNSKAQKKLLKWAASKSNLRRAEFKDSVLDDVIQEGVAHYLKSKDILPLREFLETAAKLLGQNDNEKRLPASLGFQSHSPFQEFRANVLQALCEVYGFLGDFDSAWQTCAESGLDRDNANYLIYGVHSSQRQFNAPQAYYFESLHPPLTENGRKHKAEIFPLVDEELQRFQIGNGQNLYDYFLHISSAVMDSCFKIPNLQNYSKPTGKDIFERSQFQERIVDEFRSRFVANLRPFEVHLKSLFDEPAEFLKAKERTVERFKVKLLYPLRQKRQFLYGHVYDVCTSGEKFGLDVGIYSLKKVYGKAQHQVDLPFIPSLIRKCMCKQIANIFRDCEDRFRQGLGLRGVGQGWVSEVTLFESLKKAFQNETILHHAKPEWIGRQHLDIFFPRLNLAVEYQGAQHQKAIPIFGGETGLRIRQKLDAKKKETCASNSCLLLEVFPSDPLDQIVEKIKARREVALRKNVQPQIISGIIRSRRKPTDGIKTSVVPTTKQKQSSSLTWKKHLGKDNLRACARHGDGDLIHRLAAEGVSFKRKGEILFVACEEGNIETTKALLELGANPNSRDEGKATPLSWICNRHGVRPKPEIVSLLLKYGADPRLRGERTPSIFGRCGYAFPMIGCAADGFLDCAKILLKKLRTVDQQQPVFLMTPLMCACHPLDRHEFECRSLEMIRWLVDKGASLTMQSQRGYNAMDFALGASESWYVDPKRMGIACVSPIELLKLLMDAGAHPTEPFKPLLELVMSKKRR